MKQRPRRVEARAAQELSEWYGSLGLSPIERIPVLGREGPDLTWNDLEIIVDVKSRLSCPISYVIRGSYFIFDGELLGARICNLGEFFTPIKDEDLVYIPPCRLVKPSTTVHKWYRHMAKWQEAEVPGGVTALVLHRPGQDVAKATFLIHRDNWRLLYERIGRERPVPAPAD